MNKAEIISFFDKMSLGWDNDMIKNQDIVNRILDYADIKQGKRILDVACGTGVLIPDYLSRKVEKVVGVDISSKMIELAEEKFKDYENVKFFIGDMEEIDLKEKFDSIVVYNAFPHFCNPKNLIKQLAEHLVVGGTLCIAHGMSRGQIDSCHKGNASHISNGLIHEDEMEKLFTPFFDVYAKISNHEMYVVAGKKR